MEGWRGLMRGPKTRTALGALILGALGLLAVVILFDRGTDTQAQIALPYDVFKSQVLEHNVASIATIGNIVDGSTRRPIAEPGTGRLSTSFTSQLPTFADAELEPALEADKALINSARESFTWDVVPAAPSLSTLSAVLAGFVLIAVVAILTFPPRGPIPTHDPLHPMLAAFITLVVAALLYAVLAGGGSSGGTHLAPLAEDYVVSWILAYGVLQTSVGIAWLLRDYGVADDAVRAARLMVHTAVVVLAASLAGILVQPLYVLYPTSAVANGIAWGVTAALPVLAGLLGESAASATAGSDAATARAQLRRLKQMTPVALALLVAAVVGFGVISGSSEETVRQGGYRTVFSVLVAAQVLLAWLVFRYELVLPRNSDRAERVREGVTD